MITNFNGTLWTQQSYFDFLTQHNVSWRAHYQNDLWAIMYYADVKNKPENHKNVQPLDNFFVDAKEGKLSKFTWLQPRLTTTGGLPTWQHPDASVALGEKLIEEIYEALRSSPQWNETVFIITYDECGGFFDHIPPPQQGVPPPDGVKAPNGFAFDRLGIRLPTVMVSPWIKKGSVVHTPNGVPKPSSQFESTSLMSTANKMFGITSHLTKRAEWAGTFEGLFTALSEPRNDCPEKFQGVIEMTKEEEEIAIRTQREKPLNDHLEAQVQFYCEHASPLELQGARKVKVPLMRSDSDSEGMKIESEEKAHQTRCRLAAIDQGSASDFIEERAEALMAVLRTHY